MVTENFADLKKKMNTQIYKSQRTPNRLNIKRSSSKNIIIKLSKVNGKEKNFESRKRKETRHT